MTYVANLTACTVAQLSQACALPPANLRGQMLNGNTMPGTQLIITVATRWPGYKIARMSKTIGHVIVRSQTHDRTLSFVLTLHNPRELDPSASNAGSPQAHRFVVKLSMHTPDTYLLHL